MDTDVKIQHDIVDTKSNIPIPHLSFIIQFLLPTRLVGYARSEKQSKALHEIIANDPQLNDGFFKCAFVGSVAEGYYIPDVILRSNTFKVETNTDVDILFIISELSVTEATGNEKHKLRLNVNSSHPGYARVEVLQPKGEDETFIFLKDTNQCLLSSTKLQTKIMSTLSSPDMIHGPAISTTSVPMKSFGRTWIHPHDYVCALPCEAWPSVARLWIERQTKGEWLDKSTIDEAVESGVHLVAVAHKLSKLPDLEWRISFAVTEAYIAKNVITDEQRQVYIFLKIIYLQTLKALELLTSYHLKTIFLYSCEKIPKHIWTESSGGCLLYMIDFLIECLQKGSLPNFFIPENNLIDHLTHEQIITVKKMLESIRENPLKPIFEFTDNKVMGLHSLSTPFREIVLPILEDMVNFLVHKDLQCSVLNAYLSALFKMVYVLVLERKPEEAVRYIIDVFPIIDKYGRGSMCVAQIVDSIAMNFVPDIQLTVQFLEEVIKYCDQHPDVLHLRGNLACMFHALASTLPEDSEEHMLALVQAETLFNTVVDVEDIHSATAVDFCCLLMKQGRFDEAAEKLDRFIAEELKHPMNTHCFYKKEVKVLDDTLQREVILHGKLAVNSLSMAYYLLIKCVIKNDLPSADPVVYQKIMEYFQKHCHQINTSESYSLLGYSFMNIFDWDNAKEAFQKALGICDGSLRQIKENLAICTTKQEGQVQ